MRHQIVLISVLAAAALPGAVALTSGDGAARGFTRVASTEAPAPATYTALKIIAPRHEQTIHDNTGKVPIVIALRPPLNAKQGHRLRVVLDGNPQPDRWTATSFSLQAVDRGAHDLEVIVTDSAGRELARSTAVTFYMWQASRLFEQRQPR